MLSDDVIILIFIAVIAFATASPVVVEITAEAIAGCHRMRGPRRQNILDKFRRSVAGVRRARIDDGKVTYEVEYMKDGKELDAYLTEDGQPVKGVQ